MVDSNPEKQKSCARAEGKGLNAIPKARPLARIFGHRSPAKALQRQDEKIKRSVKHILKTQERGEDRFLNNPFHVSRTSGHGKFMEAKNAQCET